MPEAPPPDRFELFGQALGRLGEALEYRLRDTISEVAADLEHAGEEEPDQRERQTLYAIAAMLRIETRSRLAGITQALHDRAHKCLEFAGNVDTEERALSLMAEDELREQILAAEIARAVRMTPALGYDQYAGRVRALMPGLWEDDDLNPLGARTVASAALSGFGNIGDGATAAPLLARSLRERLPSIIGVAIDEVERWLRVHGVEPVSPVRIAPEARSPEPGEAPAPAQAPATGEVPGADAPILSAGAPADLPQAHPPDQPQPPEREAAVQAIDAVRVLGTSPLAADGGGTKLGAVPTLQPVVEVERDAVAFAHSIDAVPYSREARGGYFGNARSRIREAGATPAQLASVDLVAAMFDYVIDDRSLPEAAKPLIWRLQQPALALSLLDPAYLGDEPRSLRRLVENFGAIVNAFAEDLSRGSELHRRLDTVVRAVEIVASALQTRSAVMAKQVEHEYSRAARNVAQLIARVENERTSLESTPERRNRRDYRKRPDRDREQQVTERLSAMLSERLARHEVPESVREFVLNVWMRHLRTAILRDGEESSEYKVALQVVDDLLWSLDVSAERPSRKRLAQKIPPLIRLLTQGLRAIGARDDEFKSFFDELFLIHLRKMQKRSRSGDSVPNEAAFGDEPDTGVPGPATLARGARGGGSGVDAPAPGAQPPAARGENGGAAAAAPGERSTAPGRPVAAPSPGAGARPAAAADDGSERKLLEVLASLDLNDLPDRPEPVRLPPEQALAGLRRGHWLRLVGRDGGPVYAKVAWINTRRTVILMVRHPDRRALSMRAGELFERFAAGRAARLG